MINNEDAFVYFIFILFSFLLGQSVDSQIFNRDFHQNILIQA